MALKVAREEVWAASVRDAPGALAQKLSVLAGGGATLDFVIARRAPDKRGKGVVFVTPLKGAAQLRAARKAGFRKARTVRSIRIEGRDAPGLGAKITQALAARDINLRGLSAAVIGKRFVGHVAVDNAADATKAIRALKSI